MLATTGIGGNGVLASVSYSDTARANQLALLNGSNGAVLGTIKTDRRTGGGPVFADGFLFLGGGDGVLHAYGPVSNDRRHRT